MPSLSVVIPTYNRWPQLRVVLESLAIQTVPRGDLEVIVVSDGSTDGTDEAIDDGQTPLPVKLLRQANQGPAVARNRGVEAATGELILFIDDDVVAEPGWAAAHVAAHERTDGQTPTVAIGPLLTPIDHRFQPWVLWEQRKLEDQYQAMADGLWSVTARQFYTGNASVARQHFIDLGGFDPSFLRGEDVELAYRMADRGTTFVFDFEARAFHYASRSYESWLAIAAAYGRNDALLWRDHGQSWILPTIHRESKDRHPLTRAFSAVGVRWPRLIAPLVAAVRPVALVADRIAMPVVAQPLLSATYAVSYRRALIEELGGLDAYRAAGTEPNEATGASSTAAG